MNDEIIKTPDGDRLWREVRMAKEASEKRSAISKQAWAKRKAKA